MMLVLLIIMIGLMGGIYFSFSIFVMKALSEVPALQAAQVMNRINEVIVKTLFLPLFFGSTLLSVGLMVWSFLQWQGLSSTLVIVATLIYVVGMFLVTVIGNVPLNNALQTREGNPQELVSYWSVYLKRWTRLNHIRTLSCILACFTLSWIQMN